MSKPEMLVQLAIYVIPALILFGAVYFFTNKWYEIQQDKLKLESNKLQQSLGEKPVVQVEDMRRHFLPMQVDAYQRLVLFLERIAPNNLIMRLNNPGLPAGAFQAKLLETIRQEYEHNLAQQIFVSMDAWEITRNSKEEVLKIINMAATKMQPTSMATDLSRAIFEITAQLEFQPTDKAIKMLKSELNSKVLG
ncbi:hypothetical protein K6119_05945 [Paracrocinitomix mangrovi]|uniref:DUF7935 family protein n=1 Tax=Paracrocinitomix mangrovi TaxID=2862509 RepID=UPI001C8D72E8|nr:hypothetical protein [Paracrocinitomix mangrovi]UKN03052.1 hypothetical protein K6119_05945 [Paracrocinitomix mangrovi]